MENKKRCLYRKLDHGIREFVFTESSNAAVDEWIDWLTLNLAEDPTPEGGTDRILFDTRQCGPLPMYYSFKRLNEWRKQYPESEQNRPSRAAQLYNSHSFYVTMAKNLMKVFSFPNSKMEYFLNDRDGAIAWLLSND
jgi:hypothetical protein